MPGRAPETMASDLGNLLSVKRKSLSKRVFGPTGSLGDDKSWARNVEQFGAFVDQDLFVSWYLIFGSGSI